jgi:hypothetical protein
MNIPAQVHYTAKGPDTSSGMGSSPGNSNFNH